MASENAHERFVFNWKIENLHYCAFQKPLFSPKFIPDVLDKAIWSICAYTEKSSERDIYFKAFRYNKTGSPNFEDDTFRMELHLSSNSKFKVLQEPTKFIQDEGCYTGFRFSDSVNIEKLLQETKILFLPGNFISISCYMWSKLVLKESRCNARTVLGVSNYTKEVVIEIPSDIKLGLFGTLTRQNRTNVLYKIEDDSSKVDLHYINKNWKTCLTCELCVLDCEMKKAFLTSDSHCFEKGNQEWTISWKPLSLRMLLANKDRYLHNNHLFLQISLTFSTSWNLKEIDYDYPTSHCVSSTESDAPYSLNNELLSFYREKHMSDFSLVANTGETFPVHKAVLVSRSPVFRAMVDNDMIEKSTNSVHIPDVDGDTLSRLLIFAYSDKIEKLEYDTASKLYFAADKYQLLSLKQKCSTFMKSIVSTSNVCDILSLADLHQDEDLKKTALDFVFINDAELIQSDEWKNFLARNLSLAADIMQQLLVHKTKIK